MKTITNKILLGTLVLLCFFTKGLYSDTSTSRLTLTKPDVGSTNWGPKLNTNMDTIDSGVAVLSATNTFTLPQTFSSGTYTTWPDGYVQKNRLFANIKDYGAAGNGTTDDTAAIQAAMDALAVGGTLWIPRTNNAYKVTSQITVNVNRITLLGESRTESLINYTPSVAGRAFLIGGALDKVTFRNFGISQTNPGVVPNCSALLVSANMTKLEIDHMFIHKLSRAGINASNSPVTYVSIHDSIFTQIEDTTSTSIGIAIWLAGSNVTNIYNNMFSENDKNFVIGPGGTSVTVANNSMEVDGDSGNLNLDYTMQISSTNNFAFLNNYIEGEYNLSGGAVLYLNQTVDSLVEGNYFSGQDSNIDKSSTTILIRGENTKNPIIRNNKFVEIKNYFLDSDQPVRVYENNFVDGNVAVSSRPFIMSYVATPGVVDLDVVDLQTYDPPSISSGTSNTSSSFIVSGSSVGDHIDVYPPYDLKGLNANAYVENSTGSVHILLGNLTGAAVDLASGSWGLRVRKK